MVLFFLPVTFFLFILISAIFAIRLLHSLIGYARKGISIDMTAVSWLLALTSTLFAVNILLALGIK